MRAEASQDKRFVAVRNVRGRALKVQQKGCGVPGCSGSSSTSADGEDSAGKAGNSLSPSLARLNHGARH
jgi:hypothetical protein